MVNRKLIYKIIGSLLLLEAGFMVLCVIMAIIYGSSEIVPFIISLLITAGAGMGLVRLGHDAPTMMTRRDSYAVVTLTWLAFSVFGSLPYMLSGIIINPTNAFFETMSGFTTTGASILNDVEQQLDSHHAILFWRSLSQWIGGLGIVFFTIAVLPSMVSGSTRVFSAEATGPIRTKMHPRLSTNAKWIWSVYLALTLGCAICYFVAGMDWFSAINYGMTTTATGGFSIHNDSLAHFQTPAIEYIGLIFQFASGINFTVLYMLIVKRQFKTFYKNSELRFYITLVAACTVVIALLLMTHNGYGVEHAFRSSCFQVVSLMTTTGIFCDHVGQWPHITWIILAALMFIGACAGSTSGGFKSIRAFMICKVIKNEFVRLLHPRAVLPVKVDGHAMPSAIVQNLLAFFAIYIIVCMATTGLMMAIGTDITNSAIISLSCVNNVGLPLNELGPDMAWSDMHWATKWLCAGLMLMGRLEILNVLILLTPSYWKDN